LPLVVPIIFHKGLQGETYGGSAIALPMYALLHKRTGEVKFETREALCAAFGVSPDTKIILTGTDKDPPLERWWAYHEDGRRRTIERLRVLGICLVTTPNYSLFANVPRFDDLHSMKRIGLVHTEFIQGGVAAALHINGRTERDFEHWGRHVGERDEITHVAYEFGTGAGRSARSVQHARWLSAVAKQTNRPLTLVVRGGLDVLPTLADAYASVVYLDTSAFMKAIKRQRAVPLGNSGMGWRSSPTLPGEPLRPLFDHNIDAVRQVVSLLAAPDLPDRAAAFG
jgi:hypothetical protein